MNTLIDTFYKAIFVIRLLMGNSAAIWPDLDTKNRLCKVLAGCAKQRTLAARA